ncbi:MAG: HigA family addiction module antidote protein [Deltaproteobacteria bacterium]|nr:HigA family addiction module antidote protein [Deltaproteobacteria bacterium]
MSAVYSKIGFQLSTEDSYKDFTVDPFRAISPPMAIRLSRLFGNSPEFWLNVQRAVDLWEAEAHFLMEIQRIRPLKIKTA